MSARIEIRQAIDLSWYWVLVGGNHQDVCVSETFTRKRDAKRGANRAQMTMATLHFAKQARPIIVEVSR